MNTKREPLTGCMIHEISGEVVASQMRAWDALSAVAQHSYDQLAYRLNEEMGLCSSCGRQTRTHEVADRLLCAGCLTGQPSGRPLPPRIIVLCGSTRFPDEFRAANLRETLAGKIVLSIGIDTKSDRDLLLAGTITQTDKDFLDELHLRKIDLANEVYVLNADFYLGTSTRNEICYALQQGKPLRWLQERLCQVPNCSNLTGLYCPQCKRVQCPWCAMLLGDPLTFRCRWCEALL